ncbi:MAG TPA: LysR family transcriptional regulator [Terriglobales bacterium]|nr:LysR family transcriptional regulator [Terriglobales bacterium]
MEIRQLRYFISAAKHLSFTKAAQECNIVQTAMTQQMAALESELGVGLFDRSCRRVALTEAGECFLREVQIIVNRTETATEAARCAAAQSEGALRIGLHGELMRGDMPCILRLFRSRHPTVRVQLRQLPLPALLRGVEQEELDCMFSLYAPFFGLAGWLRSLPLSKDGVVLVMAADHPLAKKERILQADLAQESFIFFKEPGMEQRRISLSGGEGPFRIYGEVSDHASLQALVEAGYGVTIWSERLRETMDGRLVCRKVEGCDDAEQLCLSWKEGELKPSLAAFMETVQEYFEKPACGEGVPEPDRPPQAVHCIG